MRTIVTLLVLAGIAVGGVLLWQFLARERPDIVPSPGEVVHLPSHLVGRPAVMRAIYLDREGAVLRAGIDDARVNRSSLVAQARKKIVEVSAFTGSHARWRSIVRCIRAKFAPFDVQIVDSRPVARDDYLMAVFGGRSKLLGKGIAAAHHATGLAPFSGKPIERAVVLIFSHTLHNSLRATCETASMEIAHAYGLDHGYNCHDLMTYRPRCGKRSFIDRDIPCGEHKPRPCKGGRPTQNSYRHLLNLLGPRRRPAR